MRPKKKVLVVCPIEDVLSGLVVRASVWGHSVTGLTDVSALVDRLRREAFDLVLLMCPPDPLLWNGFTRAALDAQEIQAARGSDARIFDPADTLPLEVALGVPRIFVTKADHWASLRDAIRLSVGRKRGPRAPVAAHYLPSRSVA